MNALNSLRRIARTFLDDRRATNGSISVKAADLERLLGDVACKAHAWASVASSAPPPGRRVLFYSSLTRQVYVGTRYGDRWFDEQDHYPDGTAVEVEAVTHWMRFPRRPIADG